MKQFLNYLLLFVLMMPNVLFADEIIDYSWELSEKPQLFSGGWLHYDNGDYLTNIGAGLVFRWAVMFPADDSYAGYEITKVSVYDSESNAGADSATITASIYLGGDNAPGTLATSQEFTVTGSNDFVKVELDNPVMLDGTENIWIVMECDELAFPAAACSYMNESNSNWVDVNGWGHMSDYGMDYSWMIRALLGDDTPIDELCSSSQEIEMFPNPTNGELNIECAGMQEITIFLPNGQTLEKINVNNDSYILNMNEYKSGVYYLRITGDATIVRKVVKE